MRFENGTSGKLDVPPAERLAMASGGAGRIHSSVVPPRSEEYRVIEPPTSGAKARRVEPTWSSMTAGVSCIMAKSYVENTPRG